VFVVFSGSEEQQTLLRAEGISCLLEWVSAVADAGAGLLS
jgi:hypothetical protein